jgi:hypothetical protein
MRSPGFAPVSPAGAQTARDFDAPAGERDLALIFVSERGSPFTTAGFARMVERAAEAGGLTLKARPHMLRHARMALRWNFPEGFVEPCIPLVPPSRPLDRVGCMKSSTTAIT